MEIIKGKAPLDFEDIGKLIQDENLKYMVQYDKSEIKGKELLVYLTNLDLEVDLELSRDKEGIFKMMSAYFASDISCEISALDELAMAILLEYRGLDHRYLFKEQCLTKEEMLEFSKEKENADRLLNCSIFFDSMPLYMQYVIPKLSDMLDIHKNFRVIKEKRFVTSNVCSMVARPGFIDYYLTAEAPAEMVFFEHQFDDYMFRGKRLFWYLMESESESFGGIYSLITQETQLKDLQNLREIADGLEIG